MRTEKKRRVQNKTDYKARMKLLQSNIPRVVVRKTNKYLIVQVVKSNESKDSVVCGVTSKELLNNGWDKKHEGSLKSIPAGYLTGLLIAKKMDKGDYILDMGMARHKSGSRIYAVAKGIVDSGVNLRVDKKIFPSEEKISGEGLEKLKPMVIKLIKELK